jgi:hypothetical protein
MELIARAVTELQVVSEVVYPQVRATLNRWTTKARGPGSQAASRWWGRAGSAAAWGKTLAEPLLQAWVFYIAGLQRDIPCLVT